MGNWVAGDILMHYGVSKLNGAPGPGSGRYPLGSGENPHQHSGDFISRVQELRKQGMSEKDIAKAVGLDNTTQLRVVYSNAINKQRAMRVNAAKAMIADGKIPAEVARAFGINESTLRSWLNAETEVKMTQAQATADFLRKMVEEKGMIDVGTGVELELGISNEKMKQALYILEQEGYEVFGAGVPQATNPGKQTNIKVLCPPGTEHKEIYEYGDIKTITDYVARTNDEGEDVFEKGFVYPESMDSSRLLIRYGDDIMPNGHKAIENDGLVEIRPGVADLSLGESNYAQVRILVDGDKYIKGMAVYSDSIPDGYDVVFNTNKTPDKDVLKPISSDPDNPFGALLREEGGQYYYTDENGERKLGLINKTRQEGDWGEWSHELPSQFLSKQNLQLINKQLNLAVADKEAEFQEICDLTNPTVKKHLLEEFANDCDSTAEHLKAAALPRQQYQVILPVATMGDNEVYAPNYENGETVALIRYPHGGTFEIPILTVNNKQEDAVKMIGKNAADAVGISKNVADRLSGADFDGDTVMVIPCNSNKSNVKITSTPPLKDLEGWDPKMEYGYSEVRTDSNGNKHYYRGDHEYKILSKENTQIEMGKVSNLICDMTLKGATEPEIARAVKHSMTVIDANKHKLDYKQSEVDNGIDALRKKYQLRVDEEGATRTGASTIISRAKSPVQVTKRQGTPKINEKGKEWYDPSKPEGALIYKTVVETYTDKNGKKKVRTQESTQMAETQDARSLSSGTPKENAYADFANKMKSLANKARKEKVTTGKIKYNSVAKETYRAEVQDLEDQLRIAKLNAPRERQAQLATSSELKALKRANPEMTKKETKKKSQQLLTKNRARYGAKRTAVEIKPKAWEAIQAGAVSETTLTEILRFADGDTVRAYATPKATNTLSESKQNRIKALKASGYTNDEIAKAVGVSPSTVNKYK